MHAAELHSCTPLPDTGPWQIEALGPLADTPAELSARLMPWLQMIPHESTLPCRLRTYPGTQLERGFPTPIACWWNPEALWRPWLNPWSDPGAGHCWVELVGDASALATQALAIAEGLYRGLVLDPPEVSGLVAEFAEELGAEVGWSRQRIRGFGQDQRPLQRDAEWIGLWQDRAIEGTEARMFLSLHAGSAQLPEILLPALSTVWAEAVIQPRDLPPEEIARFPRTIAQERYAPYLQACRRLGAMRRLALLERIADLIHAAAWEVQVTAVPLLDQATSGEHRVGDALLLREGWQRPAPSGIGFIQGGLGQPAWRWEWLEGGAGDPALGWPFDAPRLLEPRDALRQLLDWEQVESLRQAGIPLRAGSKGLLRTRHAAAFGDPLPALEWGMQAGILAEVQELIPLSYVLG